MNPPSDPVQQLADHREPNFWSDITFLRDLSQEMVDARKENPQDKKDLLNALILGRDSQTGQGLTDDSIANNMITFLIAGTCLEIVALSGSNNV